MKKNPTPETVDKPAIPDYTFGQARELLLALLPLLENHKSAPQDALESDTKGVSDMKKRHKSSASASPSPRTVPPSTSGRTAIPSTN